MKIAWTLGADPIGDHESVARTEMRVATADRAARARFRRYWWFASPGIVLIRLMAIGLVKTEAKRRVREAAPGAREFLRCQPKPIRVQSRPIC